MPKLPLALSCVDGVGYLTETSAIHAVGTASALTYVADEATGKSAHAHRLGITGAPAANNALVVNSDGDGLEWASANKLTQEEVEDYVGGMLDGDETFITVAYDDSDGNIDFTVPVKDEDAMGSDSATHLATQQSIKAYVDTNGPVKLQDNNVAIWQGQSSPPVAIDYQGATVSGISTFHASSTGADIFTVSAATIGALKVNGQIVLNDSITFAADAAESVEDVVGALVATGGTKTGIAVTYQDGTGDMDFEVDHGTAGGLDDDDHDQYVHKAPTGGDRNLIVQGNTGRGPFGIKAISANTVNLNEYRDSGNVPAAYVSKDFNFYTSGSVSAAASFSTSGSVSAATVSATSVSALSSTLGGSVPTTDFVFQRPFHHNAYRSVAFGANDTDYIYMNTTDQDANFMIPAGRTLKILAAYGRCQSGSTAGTTTWTLGIRMWDDQAHSSTQDYVLATNTTTDTSTYINISAEGTIGSPLASIAGSSYPVGMVTIRHQHDDSGTSTNNKHTIDVYGVYV